MRKKEIVKRKFTEVEIFNCGIGGWTSIDILINFQLNLVQLDPDVVIIYHGYNDLQYYLMECFLSDYSHGQKNLGEILHEIKMAYYMPKIKFWHSYEFIKNTVMGIGNIRNDVLKLVNTKSLDYVKSFGGIEKEMESFERILVLCEHKKIYSIYVRIL